MRTIFALSVAQILCGCTYQDMAETCEFPSDTQLQATAVSTLNLAIAWPNSAERGHPTLQLYDARQVPVLSVDLAQVSSDTGRIYDERLSICDQVDARQYDLVVDQDDWAAYWNLAQQSGEFSGGVAMPGLKPPIARNSIGLALTDKQSGDVYWVCGCLAR